MDHNDNPASPHIAYFISAHGFGHAARAAAIMAAIQARNPLTQFEIFTQVPEWFFRQSLTGPYSYHSNSIDVGLVQKNTFEEDLLLTIARLNELLPFRDEFVTHLARQVGDARCSLVLCDIAPLGIAVARACGIPSVLIENFTWDWIYQGYVQSEPRLAPHIQYLADAFESADHHIQTEPVCRLTRADFVTPPVSRAARTPRPPIRTRLGIEENTPLVLITLGGVPGNYPFLPALQRYPGVCFMIPGLTDTWTHEGNLILLPHDSEMYHPDLIGAADAVICKLGYSTVAEVYQAGVPMGYIARTHFAESGTLRRFAAEHMPGLEITERDFASGAWLDDLPRLLSLSPVLRREPNGAERIADFAMTHLDASIPWIRTRGKP
ncbi:MAG: hypothetical protein WCF84_03980 [Anaerolineae bacterium]